MEFLLHKFNILCESGVESSKTQTLSVFIMNGTRKHEVLDVFVISTPDSHILFTLVL